MAIPEELQQYSASQILHELRARENVAAAALTGGDADLAAISTDRRLAEIDDITLALSVAELKNATYNTGVHQDLSEVTNAPHEAG